MDNASEYALLCRDGAEVGLQWHDQEQHAVRFAQETMLDNGQWLKSTDCSLNALLERNEKAIQQPRWLNGCTPEATQLPLS